MSKAKKATTQPLHEFLKLLVDVEVKSKRIPFKLIGKRDPWMDYVKGDKFNIPKKK